MYNYIARVNFNRDSPKINFKIFSYSFWDRHLKLGSCVVGTKTKVLIKLIFDLGLRIDKNRNFENTKSAFLINLFSNFKIRYFHF